MRNNHLNVGVTLCHVSKRRKRTPDWLKIPNQMSDAIWIFRNRAILGMRKLPMKRFRNGAITLDTRMMISTSHFCLLRRVVSTFRAIQTVRARTNCHLFSSKSGLLAKDFCKCLAHITRTNSFYANTPISASNPLRLTKTHSSR
ncbi:hypothetical protein Bca4012_098589 [Brassica carinata]|uniref:Uncharacterized protein n=1 Tax=Brassica carinata TaxID=52824 RepID=A0A8X7TRR3_BRACI|nr:hypothetical protein Bca52824_081267 [Brassica carinata]